MAVGVYSLRVDGGKKLSPNFTVKEFRCKDGSDMVLIDEELVKILQKFRDHFGVPVTINSAYRTEAWNTKQGGGKNSQHLKGKAADIVVEGVKPLEVAKYAEGLGVKGIGYYPVKGFVHIDTRPDKYWWLNDGTEKVAVTFGYVKPEPEAPKPAPQSYSVVIGDVDVVIDGKPHKLPRVNINGSNFLELRPFGEAAGLSVKWDTAERVIRIDTGKA
jgi:hypothetical protein